MPLKIEKQELKGGKNQSIGALFRVQGFKNWAALKELILSYYKKETLLFTIFPCSGN